MIVDLPRFLARERPHWEALDRALQELAQDPWRTLTLEEARSLERLYQRATADLARLGHAAAEPAVRAYLEEIVARGYAEIYGGHTQRQRLRPWHWWVNVFPQTVRLHRGALLFATLVFLFGSAFGGLALGLDPGAKKVLMPFPHLLQSPSARVAQEEVAVNSGLSENHGRFSAQLMTHNTQVALTSTALGLTAGVGTLILAWSNGVMLGAVAVDYILDGQTLFLLGWLLPHGVVEIPALLLGAQGGFVLAGAMLGRRQRLPLGRRLRAILPDVVTLAVGTALLLVWAGLVESFLSQYHEPAVPYWAKIVFGVLEAVALTWFLLRSGRAKEGPSP